MSVCRNFKRLPVYTKSRIPPILVLAFAAFAFLNWSAFITPTILSLGFVQVQASLGLVMLGLLACFATLFLVFVVYLKSSVLLDTRRNAKELQANRELADKAEASRFTELRAFLETELKRQLDQVAESRVLILERLDQLDRDLRFSVEESGNILTAYIGELEGRLEKGDKLPASAARMVVSGHGIVVIAARTRRLRIVPRSNLRLKRY